MSVLSNVLKALPWVWASMIVPAYFIEGIMSVYVFVVWLALTTKTFKAGSWKRYSDVTLMVAILTMIPSLWLTFTVIVVNLVILPVLFGTVPFCKVVRIKLIQRRYRLRALKEMAK